MSASAQDIRAQGAKVVALDLTDENILEAAIANYSNFSSRRQK